jgi:DNA-binding NarL/FixJ family response regulator
MSFRLMIVTDDPSSASAIRRALLSTAAFDIVEGYAEGRGSCGAAATAHRPDVVVIDHMRSRADMLARIGELRAAVPEAKIVLLSVRMESAWLTQAATAGIDAAIAKTFRLDRLGALVREVAAGNVFHAFDPAPRSSLGAAISPLPSLPALTRRELEVLRLVAEGAPNSRIAAQLWITEQTVKFHLSKVYRKLGVSNRTEASHHAYVNGLLETTPPAGLAA